MTHEFKSYADLQSRSRDDLEFHLVQTGTSRYSDEGVYWVLATFEDGEDEIYFEITDEEAGSTEVWDKQEEVEKVLIDMLLEEIEDRTSVTARTAAAIRDARIEKGLSQTELADKLGIAQPRIAEWERGVKTPGLESLFEIAEALGVKASEIVKEIEGEEMETVEKYIVIDHNLKTDDEHHAFHDTLEAANDDAETQWKYLTESERKQRHIFVMHGPAVMEGGEWELPDGTLDDHTAEDTYYDSDNL